MGKFKIGDVVRRFKGNNRGGEIGHVATIEKIEDISSFDSSGPWLKFTDGTEGYATSFVLAPKFAVGDRVRAIDETCILNKGSEHVVVKVDDKKIHVEIPPYGTLDYPHEYFEHVAQQPQLTIREGRYYKTRDGRKVGPMEERGWDGQMFDKSRAITGYGWFKDGSYIRGAPSHFDLIAEWVDEPVVASEPKFKMGDRVHYKDEICEGVGVITEPNGDDDWFVEVEEHDREWAPFDGATTRIFDSVDLRLVAPATSGKEDAGGEPRCACEDEPDAKLLVSISADTSALDSEIDRVLKRLRKLKRKARKLGISLEYSELRDAA